MKVYLRNVAGQQTIRDLSLRNIAKIWLYQMLHVRKEERCVMKILL